MIPIVRVLAPNPGVYTLEGTNTWIVGREPSVVIDPGPADETHLAEVERLARPVSTVLVTHDHEDHAEGAAAFAERVGAPLRAWRMQGAEHLRDGERFHAGRAELVAVHTPGHSADHVAFHEPIERALFTGDAVVGRGTSFIDPPEGDLGKYLASLKRMLDLAPRTIHPGHGPLVLDGRAKLTEYLEHRRDREQQVLEGIANESRTVAELVAGIYADYPETVRPLAARSVLAHLLKLEREGRADKRGRGDAATWFGVGPKACARCGKPVKGRARYCPSCSLIILQGGDVAPEGRA
jgi:glyoxylase-like metal-dependent hydrolase (beta-lactamase superfamily II)